MRNSLFHRIAAPLPLSLSRTRVSLKGTIYTIDRKSEVSIIRSLESRRCDSNRAKTRSIVRIRSVRVTSEVSPCSRLESTSLGGVSHGFTSYHRPHERPPPPPCVLERVLRKLSLTNRPDKESRLVLARSRAICAANPPPAISHVRPREDAPAAWRDSQAPAWPGDVIGEPGSSSSTRHSVSPRHSRRLYCVFLHTPLTTVISQRGNRRHSHDPRERSSVGSKKEREDRSFTWNDTQHSPRINRTGKQWKPVQPEGRKFPAAGSHFPDQLGKKVAAAISRRVARHVRSSGRAVDAIDLPRAFHRDAPPNGLSGRDPRGVPAHPEVPCDRCTGVIFAPCDIRLTMNSAAIDIMRG